MESSAADQSGDEHPAEAANPGVTGTDVLPLVPDETARAREELRMLVIGFSLGLTIGGIFLLYIVLDIAKLL